MNSEMAPRREGISRLPTPASVMRVKVPARSRIGFIGFNRCVKAIKAYIRMGFYGHPLFEEKPKTDPDQTDTVQRQSDTGASPE